MQQRYSEVCRKLEETSAQFGAAAEGGGGSGTGSGSASNASLIAETTALTREQRRLEPLVAEIQRMITVKKVCHACARASHHAASPCSFIFNALLLLLPSSSVSVPQELADLRTLAASPDKEMAALARDESAALEATRLEVENAIVRLLVPQEDADERAAILEIRAGTGGLEASLFADDLRGMYEKFAATQGWKFELLGCSKSDVGGIRDCTALLTGVGVFGRLKYEAGVHRVQRVPSTERAGRVHTSTATLAVLPEAEEVDVQIDEKDLKVDVFRSSGAGGQSVNKTESAVRLTHLPTGITISMQDERSQHRNRAKAMQVLQAKLYQAANEAQRLERSANRQAQVGGGDRHERIRTYNFPQGRVTDHRVNVTKFDMDAMMNGGHTLADLIDDLAKFHAVRALSELYGIEMDEPVGGGGGGARRERDADD